MLGCRVLGSPGEGWPSVHNQLEIVACGGRAVTDLTGQLPHPHTGPVTQGYVPCRI